MSVDQLPGNERGSTKLPLCDVTVGTKTLPGADNGPGLMLALNPSGCCSFLSFQIHFLQIIVQQKAKTETTEGYAHYFMRPNGIFGGDLVTLVVAPLDCDQNKLLNYLKMGRT